jgi:hypothetical protein
MDDLHEMIDIFTRTTTTSRCRNCSRSCSPNGRNTTLRPVATDEGFARGENPAGDCAQPGHQFCKITGDPRYKDPESQMN